MTRRPERSTAAAPRTVEEVLLESFGLEVMPAPQSPLTEHGDSLDYLETIFEMEDVFGIQVSDAEAEHCQTIGDLLTMIKGKVDSQ